MLYMVHGKGTNKRYDKRMESKNRTSSLFRHKGLSGGDILLVSDPMSGKALDLFTWFSSVQVTKHDPLITKHKRHDFSF